jgi:hypothetical protein
MEFLNLDLNKVLEVLNNKEVMKQVLFGFGLFMAYSFVDTELRTKFARFIFKSIGLISICANIVVGTHMINLTENANELKQEYTRLAIEHNDLQREFIMLNTKATLSISDTEETKPDKKDIISKVKRKLKEFF